MDEETHDEHMGIVSGVRLKLMNLGSCVTKGDLCDFTSSIKTCKDLFFNKQKTNGRSRTND